MHIDQDSRSQFFGLSIAGLISYFAMNIANAYLVHVLGHAAYGDYSLSISLIFSITPFFAAGITTLLKKNLPRYLNESSDFKKNIFMSWNIRTLKRSFFIISIILLTILFLRVTYLNADIPCIIKKCENYRHFLADLLFFVPIALLLLWNSSLLNATKHSVASKMLGVGSITYVCVFVIFILELWLTDLAHYQILIAIFFGFLILSLCQYIVIYNSIIKSGQLSVSKIKKQAIPIETGRNYTRSGLSLMINSTTYVILGLINMIMIEWLSPSESVLGHYVIVSKISAISIIIPDAMNILMNPFFSGLKDSGRLKSLQSLINFQIVIGFVWLVIVLSAFLLFEPLIFTFYNINFVHAKLAICLLMVFHYLFGIFRISENICLYNDMNKILYAVSIFQIFFQSAACYFLIPLYTYMGAIYALLASEIVTAVICLFLAYSLGIRIKILGII